MAPPKPPVKPAGPATESVFAAMRKQSALAKNIDKAKKVVAVREFDGPDGDYSTILNRVSHYLKDNVLGIILEYRVVDSEELEGQKLVLFYKFETTQYRTVQEVQNEFFETLQLMGLDTDMDDTQLDKALAKLIADKTPITIRVKTSKKGGKFSNVVGLASAAKKVEATEYVEETQSEAVEEETTETTEAVDEWADEETEVDVNEEDGELDPSLPSSWVGFAMFYKGKEVEVVAADDKTMKCTISAGGKKLTVLFSALSPPKD